MEKLNLKELLQPTTSAEAADAKTQIEQAIVATQQQIKTLEREREKVLLSEDDELAAEHDEKLNAARRQLDRLKAAINSIRAQQETLTGQEKEAQARQALTEGQKAFDRGLQIIDEYRRHAEMIVDLMAELANVHAIIGNAKSECRAASIDCDLKLPHQHLSVAGTTTPEVRDGGKVISHSYYKPGISAPDLTSTDQAFIVLTDPTNRDKRIWPSTLLTADQSSVIRVNGKNASGEKPTSAPRDTATLKTSLAEALSKKSA